MTGSTDETIETAVDVSVPIQNWDLIEELSAAGFDVRARITCEGVELGQSPVRIGEER